MVKGILFDKDGTLLDFNDTWLEPYFQASNYLAELVGQSEIADELMLKGGYLAQSNSWVSDSLLASGSNAQIFAFWEQQLGMRLTSTQRAHVSSIFAHAAASYVPAVEDMSGLLGRFKSRGIALGLATMDDEANAKGMLEKLDLSIYFDFVCGADSGYGVKPEAGMVHAFCQECELQAGDVVMVGDSPKDLNMGRNAGVAMSIGVLTGAHGRGELESHGDIVLDNIGELETLFN